MPKRHSVSQATCEHCGQALFPGVAHKCPAAPKAVSDWRWMVPIITLLVVQIAGIIWWASGMSSSIKSIRDSIDQQNQRLNRIEQQYFIRPQ